MTNPSPLDRRPSVSQPNLHHPLSAAPTPGRNRRGGEAQLPSPLTEPREIPGADWDPQDTTQNRLSLLRHQRRLAHSHSALETGSRETTGSLGNVQEKLPTFLDKLAKTRNGKLVAAVLAKPQGSGAVVSGTDAVATYYASKSADSRRSNELVTLDSQQTTVRSTGRLSIPDLQQTPGQQQQEQQQQQPQIAPEVEPPSKDAEICKQIPRWLTLMSKSVKADQTEAANAVLQFKEAQTSYLLKSNEVRKIRVAMESFELVVEAILHVLAPLMHSEQNARFLLDNQLFSKVVTFLTHASSTVRQKAASVFLAIMRYPFAASRVGSITGTVELLLRIVKATRPSVYLLELYESLYRISCVEEHLALFVKYSKELLPMILQNVRDCVAFMSKMEIQGSELNLSDRQVHVWLTSMFGLVANMHSQNSNEKLRVYSIELGYIPSFVYFLNGTLRKEDPALFCAAMHAFSTVIARHDSSKTELFAAVLKTGELLLEEYRNFVHIQTDAHLLQYSMRASYVLTIILRRVLSKYEDAMDLFFQPVAISIFESVASLMSDVAAFASRSEDVIIGMVTDVLVSCLALIREILSLVRRRSTFGKPGDIVTDKLSELFSRESKDAFKVMLLVNFPKTVIHSCIGVLQLLSTLSEFKNLLGDFDMVPEVTFVVIDSVFTWQVHEQENAGKVVSSNSKSTLEIAPTSTTTQSEDKSFLGATDETSRSPEIQPPQKQQTRRYSTGFGQRNDAGASPGIARVNLVPTIAEDIVQTKEELNLYALYETHRIASVLPRLALVPSPGKTANGQELVLHGDRAVRLVSDTSADFAEMDVILDALGFLYFLAVYEVALQSIKEYAIPAMAVLLRKYYRYNSSVDPELTIAFHAMVVRLLRHLLIKDVQLACSLRPVFATETVATLINGNEQAQQHCIDIILVICRSIDGRTGKDSKEERSALIAFLKELVDRNAMGNLEWVAQREGPNQAHAMQALQELAVMAEKTLEKRQTLDIWQMFVDDEAQRQAAERETAASATKKKVPAKKK